MKANVLQKFHSWLLIGLFLSQLILLPATAHSQDNVVVTIGQPNIWSLEQAHYLLARIRERNLGIRNPALKEEDLDPNAQNGTRLEAFRSLFEAGFSFSQGLGKTNELNQQNLQFNQTRRLELFTRRSSLFDQKNVLLADKGRLNAEKQALAANKANELNTLRLNATTVPVGFKGAHLIGA